MTKEKEEPQPFTSTTTKLKRINPESTSKTNPKTKSKTPRDIYLLIYNIVNAILWLRISLIVTPKLVEILVLALHIEIGHGWSLKSGNLNGDDSPAGIKSAYICEQVYMNLEGWTRWTQTFAFFEVIHAAFGMYHTFILSKCYDIYASHIIAVCIDDILTTVYISNEIYIHFIARLGKITRDNYIHSSLHTFISSMGY